MSVLLATTAAVVMSLSGGTSMCSGKWYRMSRATVDGQLRGTMTCGSICTACSRSLHPAVEAGFCPPGVRKAQAWDGLRDEQAVAVLTIKWLVLVAELGPGAIVVVGPQAMDGKAIPVSRGIACWCVNPQRWVLVKGILAGICFSACVGCPTRHARPSDSRRLQGDTAELRCADQKVLQAENPTPPAFSRLTS
jgi:hypothetical protein